MEKPVNKFVAVTAREVLQDSKLAYLDDDRFFDAIGTWEIPGGWDALQTRPEAQQTGIEVCVDQANLKVMTYFPSAEDFSQGSVIQVNADNMSDFFEVLAGLADDILPYPQYSFIPKAN